MEHSLRVIEQKELNDQQVAVRFRCCDDESTDSWCTMSLNLSVDEVTQTLQHHRNKMANTHEVKSTFRNGTHPIHLLTGESKVVI